MMNNKKISVAVGTAAAVAFTGVAMASDLVTINESEQYLGTGISGNFVPEFVIEDCAGAYNTAGNCNMHGMHVVALAAGLQPGGATDYWTSGVAIPGGNFAGEPEEASGYLMIEEGGFDNGLFRTDGTSWFTGLVQGWDTVGQAIAEAGTAQGTHPDAGGFENGRDFWFDQVVVGYVETLLDTDGDQSNGGEGTPTLAQNFRSSVNFSPDTNLADALNQVDQRLEQMVELSSGSNYSGTPGIPFEATRQTLQMAFQVESGPNATTDPTINENSPGAGFAHPWGQLVSQDIEGYFFSCINCDTDYLIATNADHAFTPFDLDARYMDYDSGWNVVPTVEHAP